MLANACVHLPYVSSYTSRPLWDTTYINILHTVQSIAIQSHHIDIAPLSKICNYVKCRTLKRYRKSACITQMTSTVTWTIHVNSYFQSIQSIKVLQIYMHTFACVLSAILTAYSLFRWCACYLLILFPFCALSLFCCCNDPISPQQSIKFHHSYRGIKRFQSYYWLSRSEGHNFSKGCNICSITSGWKDKWDAPLSTQCSIMMIRERSIIPPFQVISPAVSMN